MLFGLFLLMFLAPFFFFGGIYVDNAAIMLIGLIFIIVDVLAFLSKRSNNKASINPIDKEIEQYGFVETKDKN